jgi:hypothetical protein
MQAFGPINSQCLNFEQKLALSNFQLPFINEHLFGCAGQVIDKLGG